MLNQRGIVVAITMVAALGALGALAMAEGNSGDLIKSGSNLKLPRLEILPPPADPEPPALIQTETPTETASRVVKRPEPRTVRATSPKGLQAVNHPQSESGLLSMRDLLPLLAVLALIGVAAFVVKRFMPARTLLTGAGVMEIVARLSLSPKQTLILVKMGRHLVLVGTTGEQMTALSEVTDPEQVAFLLGQAASGNSTSMTHAFSQSMSQESLAYGDAEFEEPDDARDDVRGLLDKVRRMTRVREVA